MIKKQIDQSASHAITSFNGVRSWDLYGHGHEHGVDAETRLRLKEQVCCVVIDEVHMIADDHRGQVILQSVITMLVHMSCDMTASPPHHPLRCPLSSPYLIPHLTSFLTLPCDPHHHYYLTTTSP